MQRVKTLTAVTSKPAYSESGTPGYFIKGDAVAAIPATVPGQDWYNMVQEELHNLVVAAGLTPSATDDTQLTQAVARLIAAQAVTVANASETVAGILKLATAAQALEGTDMDTAMTPADVAAAIAGVVRAYTAQQFNVPVVRTGAAGAQAADMNAHQLLSLTATAAISFLQATNLVVGKTMTIMIYSAASVAITWDATYLSSAGYTLPAATTAGKWLIVDFFCHKPGSLLLTGWAEEE